MAYNPNIPQATDEIATSQADILNNFAVLGAIAGNATDSSASLNSLAGFNWLYLPANGSNPPSGSSFIATQVALYGGLSPLTGFGELYINKTITTGSGQSVVQIPATAGSLATVGWSYLPSGVLIKWGSATISGASPFLFPTGSSIPAFIQASIFLVTPSDNIAVWITGLTTTGCTINSSGPGTIYWFALGA